jgi:hypothetical protein
MTPKVEAYLWIQKQYRPTFAPFENVVYNTPKSFHEQQFLFTFVLKFRLIDESPRQHSHS